MCIFVFSFYNAQTTLLDNFTGNDTAVHAFMKCYETGYRKNCGSNIIAHIFSHLLDSLSLTPDVPN